MALNCFIFQKLTKIRLAAGGFAPRTPKPPAAEAPTQTSSVLRLSYTSLLTHVSQVRHLHFLTISLRPLPLANSWLSANKSRLQIFHSTISLFHKSSSFEIC